MSLIIFFQKFSSYHYSLYFTCSFINFCDPCISVVSFCWHICHKTHTSKDLNALKTVKKGYPFRKATFSKIGKGFIWATKLVVLLVKWTAFATWQSEM